MITIRRAAERGHTRIDWLDSWHTFSFGEYFDPAHIEFRALRVINEDHVAPGRGFGTHPHHDMEIVTYVLDGALEHRDSLGNGSTIWPGEIQRMSAGTGIRHSEFNGSKSDTVHLLQIWIMPERAGLAPGYEQRALPDGVHGGLRLIASRDGRDGSVTVHQDAEIHAAQLATGATAEHSLATGRYAWLQVARGAVTANGQALRAGDGAAFSDERAVQLRADADAEVLLFDLA
ncbi:MAG TPA: pirin family protein [Candidatus Dormibacteraeota bacterium]|nr:pirin family protein [Candidatus Dormibacteraeota bacterium]